MVVVEVRQQTLAWMVVVEVRQGTLVVDGRGGGGEGGGRGGGGGRRQLTQNLTTLTWQVGKETKQTELVGLTLNMVLSEKSWNKSQINWSINVNHHFRVKIGRHKKILKRIKWRVSSKTCEFQLGLLQNGCLNMDCTIGPCDVLSIHFRSTSHFL